MGAITDQVFEFLQGIADEDDARRKRVALVVCGAAVLFALVAHAQVYDALAGPFPLEAEQAAALQGPPHFGAYVALTVGGKAVSPSELKSAGVSEVRINLRSRVRQASADWQWLDVAGKRIAVKVPAGARPARVEGTLREPTGSEAGKLRLSGGLVLDGTTGHGVWLLAALAVAFAFAFAAWVYWRAGHERPPESLSILGRPG